MTGTGPLDSPIGAGPSPVRQTMPVEVTVGCVTSASREVRTLLESTDGAEALRLVEKWFSNAYKNPQVARLRHILKSSADYRKVSVLGTPVSVLLRVGGFEEQELAWCAAGPPQWAVLKVVRDAVTPVLTRALVATPRQAGPALGSLQANGPRSTLENARLRRETVGRRRRGLVVLPLRLEFDMISRLQPSDLSGVRRAAIEAWWRAETDATEVVAWLDLDVPAELRVPVSWLASAAGSRLDVVAPHTETLWAECSAGPEALLQKACDRLREEHMGRDDLTDEEANLTFRRLLLNARRESGPAAAHLLVQLQQELVLLAADETRLSMRDTQGEVAAKALEDTALAATLHSNAECVRETAESMGKEQLDVENWALHRYLCGVARAHKALQTHCAAVELSSAYNLLGVEQGCDAAALKRAYREMCRKHHPDKGGDAILFQACHVAYTRLLNRLGHAPEGTAEGGRGEPGAAEDPALPQTEAEVEKAAEAAAETARREEAKGTAEAVADAGRPAPDLADQAAQLVQFALEALDMYLAAAELVDPSAARQRCGVTSLRAWRTRQGGGGEGARPR